MSGPIKLAIEDPQTYEIIGAAIAVHNEIGSGFLEPVYRAAFSIALEERSIPFARDIIVEIKAIPRITPQAHAQAINYVKAAKQQRGLLINFGSVSLQYKRCT